MSFSLKKLVQGAEHLVGDAVHGAENFVGIHPQQQAPQPASTARPQGGIVQRVAQQVEQRNPIVHAASSILHAGADEIQKLGSQINNNPHPVQQGFHAIGRGIDEGVSRVAHMNPVVGAGIDAAVHALPQQTQQQLPKPSQLVAGAIQAVPRAGVRATNSVMGVPNYTPTAPTTKLLLGNQPVGQFKDYTQENLGVKTGNKAADTALGVAGSVLDVLPAALPGKTAKAAETVTEDAVKGAKALDTHLNHLNDAHKPNIDQGAVAGGQGFITGPQSKSGVTQELSDASMKVKNSGAKSLDQGKEVHLDDLVKHPVQKDQYPHLYDKNNPQSIKVAYNPDPKALQTTIDKQTGQVLLARNQGEIKTQAGKERLVEEIQHSIDDFEGRPSGTTPEFERYRNAPQSARDAHASLPKLKNEIEKLQTLHRRGNITDEQFFADPSVKAFKQAHQTIKDAGLMDHTQANQAYLADPGEQLAKSVASRSHMPQEALDANPNPVPILPEAPRFQPRIAASAWEDEPKRIAEAHQRVRENAKPKMMASDAMNEALTAFDKTGDMQKAGDAYRQHLADQGKLYGGDKKSQQYVERMVKYHRNLEPTQAPITGQKLESKPYVSQTKVGEDQPRISTQDYLNNQLKAQEIARKSESPTKTKATAILQEAKKKLVDSNAPIEDILNQAIKDGAGIAPKDNLTYQIDKSLRAPQLAAQFAEDHGLAEVITEVPNLDEFNQYLIAKHAQDLGVKEIKTGRNYAQDTQLVKDLAPKYEAFAQKINQYTHDVLDYSASKGLISKELATHLKAEYPNYVPLNRIFNEGEQQVIKGDGKGTASISSQSVVQRIKGSDRQIENPLESLLAKTHDAFVQGERNDAARLLASYEKLPGNPFELKEIHPNETIGTRHTVSFLDQGKKRTFETTKEVSEAAKSLTREQLGFVGQVFAVPTRILRLGATGVNLPFIGANIVKDQATAFINSSHAASTSIANPANFVRALINAVGHGHEYDELLRNAAGGTSFDISRNAAQKTVASLRADRNVVSKIAYTATHPGALLRAVEDTVGRSEELGRIQNFTGTRDALLKEGKSLEDANILAAHAARNNSTNFARAGDYGRVANSVLPYLNAGVQGSRVFLRNLQNRPVQTGAKLALTVFTPMAALTAWNLSDPKRKAAYDNMRDFEKENNFILIPPNPTQDDRGRWNIIKIPMSQEVANLASIVRNGVEALHGDKAFDFKQLAANLAGSASSLNVQSPRQLLGQFTPQAIKPGVEAATNTNLFTGAQIVPDSLKSYPAGMQYRPNTSGTAVKVGKALHVSPLQIENFASTAGGGVGRQLLNVSDRALAGLGAIDTSQIGGQDTADAISSRFTKGQGQTEKSVAYQQAQDAAKAKNATKVPKALAGAGLEKSNILTGNDSLDKSQARINAAKKKLPAGISDSAANTISHYAQLTEAGRAKLKADPQAYLDYNSAKYEEAKLAGDAAGQKKYGKLVGQGKAATGATKRTASSGTRRSTGRKSTGRKVAKGGKGKKGKSFDYTKLMTASLSSGTKNFGALQKIVKSHKYTAKKVKK